MYYLIDIASIRSGHLFRGKIEADAAGTLKVIQIGDITPDARLKIASLTSIRQSEIKSSQLLEPGECIFISRGQRKHAVALPPTIDRTIATSQFFILRPVEWVLPEYLAWYINQRPAQRYIEEHSRGSAVTLINLEALKMLEIPVPTVEAQRRIVQVDELRRREKELLQMIERKRSVLIETTLVKATRSL